MKIGVTESIHRVLNTGTIVGPKTKIDRMDVSLILCEEDGLWVDHAYRRLRPLFCVSLEDAVDKYQMITKDL